jgi:hypothetical protein
MKVEGEYTRIRKQQTYLDSGSAPEIGYLDTQVEALGCSGDRLDFAVDLDLAAGLGETLHTHPVAVVLPGTAEEVDHSYLAAGHHSEVVVHQIADHAVDLLHNLAVAVPDILQVEGCRGNSDLGIADPAQGSHLDRVGFLQPVSGRLTFRQSPFDHPRSGRGGDGAA